MRALHEIALRVAAADGVFDRDFPGVSFPNGGSVVANLRPLKTLGAIFPAHDFIALNNHRVSRVCFCGVAGESGRPENLFCRLP